MTTPAAPAAAAAEGTAPLWEDFVDIFTQPGAVFARRREGRFGAALLVLTVLAAALFFATRPLLQPLIDRSMEYGLQQQVRQGAVSAEKAAQARAGMERLGNVFAVAGAFLGVPFTVTVSALLLWLGAKLASARVDFSQAMMVATYANVPRVVVGGALGAVLLSMVDVATLPPMLQAAPFGPARFLGPDADPVLVMLAQRFDLIVLWATALAGVGVAVVGRVSRARGFAATAMVWAAATLYFLYQGWKMTF